MIEVVKGRSLRKLNTLGFARDAERYAEAPDEDTLLTLLEMADSEGWNVFVLGGGSNLVLTRDVPGLVVRPTGSTVTTSLPAADGGVRVTAEAGVGWHALVERTLELGLGGLENLALIPGTVGAAPVQNIGAYGVELDQRLFSLRAWHRPSRRWHELETADCGFGYRDSRFKRERGDWVITRVTFELGPQRPVVTDYASLSDALARRGIGSPSPRDVAAAVIAIRRAKLPDPDVIGNAGSFFQNPVVPAADADALVARFPDIAHHALPDGRVKIAAGWMIDQLGFRGWRENGIGVHDAQALVLVNCDDGDGASLLRLASRIMTEVEDRYGIRLEIEPLVM